MEKPSLLHRLRDDAHTWAVTTALAFAVAWVWGAMVTFTGDLALPPIMIAVVAVFVVAMVFVGWAQWGQISDRAHRKGREHPTPEQLRQLILGWMERYGYTVTIKPKGEAADWQIEVQRPGLTGRLVISQEVGAPWITIGSLIGLSPRHAEFMARDEKDFLREFGFSLMPVEVEWQFVSEVHKGFPRQLIVERHIAMDGSTHPLEFLRALGAVDRGFKLAVIVIQRLAGTTDEPKALPPAPRKRQRP